MPYARLGADTHLRSVSRDSTLNPRDSHMELCIRKRALVCCGREKEDVSEDVTVLHRSAWMQPFWKGKDLFGSFGRRRGRNQPSTDFFIEQSAYGWRHLACAAPMYWRRYGILLSMGSQMKHKAVCENTGWLCCQTGFESMTSCSRVCGGLFLRSFSLDEIVI
jgi:hypothetical protein